VPPSRGIKYCFQNRFKYQLFKHDTRLHLPLSTTAASPQSYPKSFSAEDPGLFQILVVVEFFPCSFNCSFASCSAIFFNLFIASCFFIMSSAFSFAAFAVFFAASTTFNAFAFASSHAFFLATSAALSAFAFATFAFLAFSSASFNAFAFASLNAFAFSSASSALVFTFAAALPPRWPMWIF
jgi:hypothetical protein